jgi:Nucleolar pre-ribosomal-associated protein 1
VSENEWDWLVEVLHSSRIHSTIKRFPIKNQTLRTKYIDKTELVLDPLIDDTRNQRNKGRDDRYSPIFVLPIILGALEDDINNNDRERYCPTPHVVEESGNDNKNNDNQYYTKHTEGKDHESWRALNSIINTESIGGLCFIQRLCDKGIVALALVSLCSDSSVIREISFAILGRILIATDTVEARRMGTWHNRPQLEMVLKSVIRSLVIHHSTSKTTVTVEEEKLSSLALLSADQIVPKLSSFAAVFLAKASFIVSNPTDPMYGVIHRYFLRIESHHGAFQDSYKIPSFMYLFCSSSATDPSQQVRKERRFAIELIRDGCLDEDGYRLLQLSYIPDLLLTALENPIAGTTQENEKESIAILQALCRMCQTGGTRAVQHLICRLGILSWIRTFLIGHDFLLLFVTTSSRSAFFDLTKETLKLTSTALTNKLVSIDDIYLSLVGIANAVCDITVQVIKNETIDSVKDSIVNDAIDLLHELTKIRSNDKKDSVNQESSSFEKVYGIQIATIVAFVSCIPDHTDDDDDGNQTIGNYTATTTTYKTRMRILLEVLCNLTIIPPSSSGTTHNNDDRQMIGKLLLFILQHAIQLEQRQHHDKPQQATMMTDAIHVLQSSMTATATSRATTTLRCTILKQIKVLAQHVNFGYLTNTQRTVNFMPRVPACTAGSIEGYHRVMIQTILDKLLIWRRFCSMNQDSRELWYDCVSMIIQRYNDMKLTPTTVDDDDNGNDDDVNRILYLSKAALNCSLLYNKNSTFD